MKKTMILLLGMTAMHTASAMQSDAAVAACDEINRTFGGKSRAQIAEMLKPMKADRVLERVEQCRSKANGTTHLELYKASSNETFVTDKNNVEPVVEDVKKEAEAQDDIDKGLKNFNFALGVGTIRVSKGDVRDTLVDNGVLRVTDSEKNKLGFWVTTNTFFDEVKRYRWGMFVGAQFGGEDKLINSLAVGFSLASLRKNPAGIPNGKTSDGVAPLVIQLGYGWTRVQRLADGYVEGGALPAGANQAVLRKSTAGGPVLLVSYALN